MLRLTALTLVIPLLATAQGDFAVDRSTLPNGLDILLHVDRKAPTVHVNLRIRAGSKNEKPGQYGLAHLVEHLFYEDRDGNPLSNQLERLGATNFCGDLNDDFTEFCATIPSGRLESYLWAQSNPFALFFQNLTQHNLDNQREVVINERRQRLENEPYHLLGPIIEEQLFPPGHPYHHDVLGSVEDLRAVTLDRVRAFFAEHYTPDQISIAIAGDFEPAQAKSWVAKYFGPLPPADLHIAPVVCAAQLAAPKFVDFTGRFNDERVNFAFVGPAAASRDAAALDFAKPIWTDDYSPHHLHKVITDKFSQAAGIDQISLQDASIYYPNVTVVPGSSIAAIEEKITSEFARFAREGPTAAEMNSIRNRLAAHQLDDLESLSSLAYTMQQVHHFYGGIDHWRDWITRYDSITADEVRAAVNRWLVVPSHLTIDVKPQNAAHPQTPQPDRTTRPPFQPDKTYRPPEIQSAKLANGLEILLLERHDLPRVAVRLQFRMGALQGPPEKPAVMVLAASAARGSTTRSQDDIARAFDELASGAHGEANLNATDFYFDVLRKNLDPVLRLMGEMLLHTSYPDWTVDAYKKDWIAEIERPEGDLANFARPLYAAAFGADHPLGRSLGTPDSLRAVTTADVRDFHDRFWKPNIAALVFAGDITLKDAIALSTAVFGGWTGTAPSLPPMPPPAPTHDRIVYVDRKGVSQTMIVAVLPAIPRDHADYPALLLADSIFGGMSDSRIWENIRQQHGIAYYAHSGLTTFPGVGIWTIQSPVQLDSTALAMREFEKELSAFGRARPITPAELDQAKTGFVRSIPEDFETVGAAAGTIAWNWAQGLPLSELQSFSQRLAAVTLDQVNAVARKYAHPENAFFLLVGDRQKIEPQLRDFR